MLKLNYVGTGTRVLNFCVDTVIILILTTVLFKIYKWYVFYYHISYWNFGWFFFGVLFVYYTILEIVFARTPGKWFTQTKVVNKSGSKPSVIEIIIRSIVRLTIIDMFFIPFLDKPLHDYISKTDVVML